MMSNWLQNCPSSIEISRFFMVPIRTSGDRKCLLTNAVIWTAGDAGILEDAWMLVERGQITGLGTGLLQKPQLLGGCHGPTSPLA